MVDSWITEHAAVCGSISQLKEKYRPSQSPNTVDADGIVAALNQFQECVRYLNTRRSSGAVLNLDSEANVQDAVFLMLRPWIHDLKSENPTDRVSNRYSIKDFLSPQAETVIEIKYIRDKAHGRQISREMHDDIEVYRHHPRCRTIIFFVYDADSLIPDNESLRTQIEEPRIYGGKPLRCILIIKP